MLTRGSHKLTKKNDSSFFFVSLSCTSWAPLVRLSCAWWKSYFLYIFKCFWSFLTMQTHAQACVRWSKYTTLYLQATMAGFMAVYELPNAIRGKQGLSLGLHQGIRVRAKRCYEAEVEGVWTSTKLLFIPCTLFTG